MAESITAKPGRDFQVKVADPAVSPSVYVSIGGLRNTELTINNNPVDITSVTSLGFQELLSDGGIQSFQVSCDGIKDSLTTGATILNLAAVNRTNLEVEVISGHGDGFFGTVVVETWGRQGAHDNAEQFTASLNSTGPIIYNAAP